jgi:DNA-binding MarR family transcriptional regulator
MPRRREGRETNTQWALLHFGAHGRRERGGRFFQSLKILPVDSAPSISARSQTVPFQDSWDSHIFSFVPPSSEKQEIFDAIRRLVEALRQSTREAEKGLGISGAQLFVLQKLSAESGLALQELAERTFTHQSSVSVVVSRLEERGLVERRRSESDGRRTEVHLTRRGGALLQQAPSPLQERLREAIEGFTERDRRQLARLLTRLNAEAGIVGPASLFFEGVLK